MMLLVGGAFEKWLGHEGGALMHEISALIKNTRGAFLPCENATKICDLEVCPHLAQTSSLQNWGK